MEYLHLAKFKNQLMKHLILLLFFSGISNYSIGQLKPKQDTINDIQRIDLKLEKFRQQHQSGVVLTFIGAGIILIPTLVNGEANGYVIAAGSIFSMLGVFKSLNSYKHLRYNPTSPEPPTSKSESKEKEPKAKPKSWWTPR